MYCSVWASRWYMYGPPEFSIDIPTIYTISTSQTTHWYISGVGTGFRATASWDHSFQLAFTVEPLYYKPKNPYQLYITLCRTFHPYQFYITLCRTFHPYQLYITLCHTFHPYQLYITLCRTFHPYQLYITLCRTSDPVVTCAIMQKTGAGFHSASSCYWDNTTDGTLVQYCVLHVYGCDQVYSVKYL